MSFAVFAGLIKTMVVADMVTGVVATISGTALAASGFSLAAGLASGVSAASMIIAKELSSDEDREDGKIKEDKKKNASPATSVSTNRRSDNPSD
ncbi:hypothetical protein K7X08_021279 [Anisodus acutangulus]|uniref:Uncharacterized protein n=1 Tax=Anisodus acutangulus TaxID=402998 RepID=A0A9Q1R8Y3_9SOLA|nr:hypothetical protein K7X08_021279 [Anisodus acutangulus]